PKASILPTVQPDNLHNRIERGRAAEDPTAASDVPHVRAPIVIPRYARAENPDPLLGTPRPHPYPPGRRPANLALKFRIPSRVPFRSQRDQGSALTPRPHVRDRGAPRPVRGPSHKAFSRRVFVRQASRAFFLNLLLDGSGSVRFK